MRHEHNCFLLEITHHYIFSQRSDALAHIYCDVFFKNVLQKQYMSITGKKKYKLKKTKIVNITYVPSRHEQWQHVSSRKPSRRFSVQADTCEFFIKIRCHCLSFHNVLFSINSLFLSIYKVKPYSHDVKPKHFLHTSLLQTTIQSRTTLYIRWLFLA